MNYPTYALYLFYKNTCKINTSYPGEKQIVRGCFEKESE